MPDDDPIRFPQSRVAPARGGGASLGLGPIATMLGIPESQCTGHWCSRCRGVWYGYLLEVECPACGNRHG